MNLLRHDSSERPLGRSVRRLFGPRTLVWLSLGALSCGFAALAQSPSAQPVATAAASATPEAQQAPDQQLPGSISGTVVDSTGAVVPGARVTLKYADPSSPQEILSGDDGRFSFATVAPGAFEITITAVGFADQTSSGILHSAEAYIAPPMPLALAAVTTDVQVRVPRNEVAIAEVKGQETQRVLGAIPNFYVSYVPDAVPMRSRQKFELAWKTMTDPVTLAMTGVIAGAQQAQNSFSGYGQGGAGYAKRFGAAYADAATSTFLGNAILPALLKQDPRYFYKGTGSTRSRILYAIANSVICKGDNQRWQPNYSAILGGLASSGISNLYYPQKDRGASLVFEDTAIGTGTTAVFNLFQEFVVRKLTPHVPNRDSSP